MAERERTEELAMVAWILARYDALPTWTMTESRYVATQLEISDSRAYRLCRTARQAMR